MGSVNWPFKISVFFIFTHFLSEMPNPAPVLRDIGIIFRVCIQRAASFSCLYKCRVSTLPFVFMGYNLDTFGLSSNFCQEKK